MPVTPTPPRSRRLTRDDARLIWLRRSAGAAQHEIVAELGVNQGRISEVLSGKRFPEVQPTGV